MDPATRLANAEREIQALRKAVMRVAEQPTSHFTEEDLFPPQAAKVGYQEEPGG